MKITIYNNNVARLFKVVGANILVPYRPGRRVISTPSILAFSLRVLIRPL